MVKPTLVIMAAGMGSRYGGLKQIDPIGPNGEIVIDYSIYDAIRAGFGKVVFVIRRDIEKAFREVIEPHVEGRIPYAYAYQALDALPPGFTVPAGRTKPWGTGQAVLACRDVINEPFGVVNADDFYGRESFQVLGDALRRRSNESTDFVLVGFGVARTLSDHGAVSRGICSMGPDGYLQGVVEQPKIEKRGDRIVVIEPSGESDLSRDAVVSMNMWGFSPALFPSLEGLFHEFLKKQGGELKSEFFIPTLVDSMLKAGEARVQVVPSPSQWLGMTYPEDKPLVRTGMQALIDAGQYPTPLWT